MIIFKDNDTDCDNLIRTHFLSNDMLTENMIKIIILSSCVIYLTIHSLCI